MTIKSLLTGGLSLAVLLTAPLLSPVRAEISDADFTKAMDAYFAKDSNIEKIAKSFERYAMKRQRASAAEEAEKMKKEMEEQFKNPVKFDIGSSPVKGKADAKVTIVEFSDFQCPYCRKGMEIMDEVTKMYPNDVKLAFKHLPLPMHPEAKPAAKAAWAAQQQGKFWEMHDMLFKNQQALGKEAYPKFAKDLGLDTAKFEADMNSAAADKAVESDESSAEQLAFNGTPSFLVGGVKVSGARPAPFFKEIIDRLLAGPKK